MPEQLTQQLDGVRERIRKILWIRGACWVLAGAAAVLIFAGLVDWTMHASSGLRLIFLLSLFCASAALAHRYLWRPLTVPIGDLTLAWQVEKLNPQLAEKLSTTVAFLRRAKDDPLAGSRTLREQVIQEGLLIGRNLNFSAVVDGSIVRKASATALCLFMLAGALIMASPADAKLAVLRLVRPFSGPAWPLRTRLAVSAPHKTAKGDSFFVDAHVEGVIPTRAQIYYRFAGGEAPAPETMQWTDEDSIRGGFEPVVDPFEFQIVAGDAVTEWIPVDVVPAPEIVELNLRADYPAYTRIPAEKFPEGRGQIRAVVGTKVHLTAKVNKPIQSAELVWDSSPKSAAKIQSDGSAVEAEFVVQKDDQYRLVVRDSGDMTNESRTAKQFRVQAIVDAKPEIVIEQPTGDLDVTASAKIPFRLLAKDDFGVGSVELEYIVDRAGTGSPNTEVKPNNPAASAVAETKENWIKIPLYRTAEGEKRRLVEYVWDLSSLTLSPGMVVRCQAVAADLRTPPSPNVAKSRQIRLRVVTKDDFVKQMENEQQLLREEVQRLLKMQETAQTQTKDVGKQFKIVGKLSQSEIENLQSTEMLQRRIREKVIDSDQSLSKQVDKMLQNLRHNDVQGQDANQRLAMIQSELSRIAEQHLPPITQSITRARKTIAPDAWDPSRPKNANSGPDSKDSEQSKAGASKDSSTKSSNDESKAGKSDAVAKGSSISKDSKSANSSAATKGGGESPPNGPNENAEAAKHADGGSKTTAKDSAAAKSSEAVAKSKQAEAKSAKSNDGSSKDSAAKKSVADPAQDLADAAGHQQQVVDSLSQMLEQLDKWETVAQVAGDARELQRRQAQVGTQVDKLAPETLGKKESELTPEQRAAVGKAADSQEANRDQWQRLQRKMERLAEKTQQEDPVSASALKDAVAEAEKQNLAGKMADAQQDIRGNRMGDAAQKQRQIDEALRSLVDSLENRREQELARLVKMLKKAEGELDELRAEQKRLLQKTKEAQAKPDSPEKADELKRLAARQRELRSKSEEFARRLSRMRAQEASQRSGRAAGRMEKADQQLGQGQGEEAQKQQDQALEELEKAQEDLAKARRKAEQELAEEQLAKISDSIRQLHQRQLGVQDELARLEGLRKTKANLSRGELQSLSALSKVETGLSAEAKGLTDKLTGAKVFVMVLDQAGEKMNESAEQMSKRQTGEPAQQPAQAAAKRIQFLLESLKNDPSQAKKKQEQKGGGGGEGSGGGQDGIPNIAQIKLLKLLQEELNDTSQQMADKLSKTEKSTSEDQKRIEELSRRQGRLADMIREISQPAAEEAQGDEK